MKKQAWILAAAMGFIGCVDGDGGAAQTEEASQEIGAHGPTLVQSGSGIKLLAVTSDDWAVYQLNTTVLASPLRGHAGPPLVIAEEPPGATAFPLQVGKEVFVWTTPQRNLPGFGVSPLILFTSKRGAELISTQSAVGLVATDASDDDKQILFTTNVDAAGARGDLFIADTNDVGHASALLEDIPMNFPSGPCRPLAVFVAHDIPAAAYCPGSDTTATLSLWKHGKRKDVTSGIAIEMPFTLSANPQGDTFLLSLADGRIVTVTDEGKVTTRDQGKIVQGALNRRGNAVYDTAGTAGLDLRVSHHGRQGETVSPLALFLQDRHDRSGYGRSRLLSADGSLALFAAVPDPTFGAFGVVNDMNLVEVDTGEVLPLQSGALNFQNSEVFTADSHYGFWLDFKDINVGVGALMSGSVRHGLRQLGPSLTVFDALRASGSRITYNDNPNGPQTAADLYVVDADRPDEVKLISRQANTTWLPNGDRDSVVFASEVEAGGPGLYVARAR